MDDWQPTNKSNFHEITMGGITDDGAFVPFGQPINPPNIFSSASDPVVRRLGEFISAAPTDASAAVGAMGGILIGIRLAQLDPAAAQRVLDHVDRVANGLGPLEDAAQAILNDTD